MTPKKPNKQIVPPDDADRLACSQQNVGLLGERFTQMMSTANGAVQRFHFAVERGKVNENPHNQGFVETSSARTREQVAMLLDYNIRECLGYLGRQRRIPNITLFV